MTELCSVALSDSIRTLLPVATIADLKALDPPDATKFIQVLGYHAAGDGGGGEFYWDSASTATDNGGTIIAPDAGGVGRWRRIYSGAVNVEWFGAKGDGTTDDIVSINKAVDWLVTLGGGTLFFPEGTYMVSTHVKIRDNITYAGTGWGSIIKARSNSTDNVMGDSGLTYSADISNVVIRDLQIDGNRANVAFNTDDAFQNGIRLHKNKKTRIQNVYIHDVVFNGISVYLLSSDSVIENNYIKDVGKTGSAPGAATYMGIFIEYAADNVQIRGNTIDTVKDAGILIHNSADGGIRYVDISGNRILGCQNHGIYARDKADSIGTLEHINIKNNTVTGCGIAAVTGQIVVEGFNNPTVNPKDITIAGNLVSGGGQNGIVVGTNVLRSVVSGNVSIGNANTGLMVNGTDAAVFGNVLLTNTIAQLSLGGTRVIDSGNIIDTAGLFLSNKEIRSTNKLSVSVGSGNDATVSLDQSGVTTLHMKNLATSGVWELAAGVTAIAQINRSPADGEIGFKIYRNVGGTLTLQQVTMGAVDSGGAGFKVLRVPN